MEGGSESRRAGPPGVYVAEAVMAVMAVMAARHGGPAYAAVGFGPRALPPRQRWDRRTCFRLRLQRGDRPGGSTVRVGPSRPGASGGEEASARQARALRG